MSENIDVKIDAQKIKKEFQTSFNRATRMIKSEIAKDCAKYLPLVYGDLKKSSIFSQTTDDEYLIWNTPKAKFLYYGNLMVDERGSAWARYNQPKKVKTPTQKLNYNQLRNKYAGEKWFEKAKTNNLKKWLKIYAKGAER